MRLSILFEARDPGLEKTLEPYLQGNFGAYRFKRPRNFVPTMAGMQGKLAQAVRYHAREMNGERWRALEQAFLNRAVTFSGKPSDYMRPRMTLFTYLNNIKEPWPEGEAMAQNIFKEPKEQTDEFHTDDKFGNKRSHVFDSTGIMGTRIYNRYMSMLSPGMLQYLINKKQYIPNLVDAIIKIMQADAEEERKHNEEQQSEENVALTDKVKTWKQDYRKWLPGYKKRQAAAAAAKGLEFHTDDSFGNIASPPPPWEADPTAPQPPKNKSGYTQTWIPSYYNLKRRLGKQTVDLMQQYVKMFTNAPGPQQQ